jgi:gamma-glutamyl hercynylcysteine S-oxide synthase
VSTAPSLTTYSATQFQQDLAQVRSLTLERLSTVSEPEFCQLPHADFSPLGWHLGHIAYTEARWLLATPPETLAPNIPHLTTLYAADGLPKAERQYLPSLAVTLDYLAQVRSQVEASLTRQLEQPQTETTQRLWQFILQHESQHRETMTIVLALLGRSLTALGRPELEATPVEHLVVPAGGFWMGSDTIAALDNERPDHWVVIDNDYTIASQPVTNGEYRQFIAAGGYVQPEYWSTAGQQWLQSQIAAGQPITQPHYWSDDRASDPQPVCGVSAHEAEAFARFMNKRLPTEAEWEKAVQLAAQQPGPSPYHWGQVWEWTSDWFDGYAGFAPSPYPGYSQTYFDQAHRVLRGGSWATQIRRPSFRNWYYPETRMIFAGFRLCENGQRL